MFNAISPVFVILFILNIFAFLQENILSSISHALD